MKHGNTGGVAFFTVQRPGGSEKGSRVGGCGGESQCGRSRFGMCSLSLPSSHENPPVFSLRPLGSVLAPWNVAKRIIVTGVVRRPVQDTGSSSQATREYSKLKEEYIRKKCTPNVVCAYAWWLLASDLWEHRFFSSIPTAHTSVSTSTVPKNVY